MKTIFLSIILSLLIPDNTTGLTIKKDIIQLSIDRNTTNAQLTSYREQLAKKNIDFWVEKITYDEDNKIKYIKIAVDCNDGFKGSSGETFLLHKKNSKVGFFRIYNTPGIPFGMRPSLEE